MSRVVNADGHLPDAPRGDGGELVEQAAELVRRYAGEPVAAARHVVTLVRRVDRDRGGVDDLRALLEAAQREKTAESVTADAYQLAVCALLTALDHGPPRAVEQAITQARELVADTRPTRESVACCCQLAAGGGQS